MEPGGAQHLRPENDAKAALKRTLRSPGVTLVEVPLRDTLSMRALGAGGPARRVLRRFRSKSRLGRG